AEQLTPGPGSCSNTYDQRRASSQRPLPFKPGSLHEILTGAGPCPSPKAMTSASNDRLNSWICATVPCGENWAIRAAQTGLIKKLHVSIADAKRYTGTPQPDT